MNEGTVQRIRLTDLLHFPEREAAFRKAAAPPGSDTNEALLAVDAVPDLSHEREVRGGITPPVLRALFQKRIWGPRQLEAFIHGSDASEASVHVGELCDLLPDSALSWCAGIVRQDEVLESVAHAIERLVPECLQRGRPEIATPLVEHSQRAFPNAGRGSRIEWSVAAICCGEHLRGVGDPIGRFSEVRGEQLQDLFEQWIEHGRADPDRYFAETLPRHPRDRSGIDRALADVDAIRDMPWLSAARWRQALAQHKVIGELSGHTDNPNTLLRLAHAAVFPPLRLRLVQQALGGFDG